MEPRANLQLGSWDYLTRAHGVSPCFSLNKGSSRCHVTTGDVSNIAIAVFFDTHKHINWVLKVVFDSFDSFEWWLSTGQSLPQGFRHEKTPLSFEQRGWCDCKTPLHFFSQIQTACFRADNGFAQSPWARMNRKKPAVLPQRVSSVTLGGVANSSTD